MVPVRGYTKGSKGKAKGTGKNGKNGYTQDKGKGKGNTEAYPPLPSNGRRGGKGKGRGGPKPRAEPTPPWGPKNAVIVKPKGDTVYIARKALEAVSRAGGRDSDVEVYLKTHLDQVTKAQEEALPISERIERHQQRLQSATADFDKKLAAHTALEEEIQALTDKLAQAHEAMWTARHKITTLEEEIEVLRALEPPPPPPPPPAANAGGQPDSIENILGTAMHGITQILPAERLGSIAKAFEAMHEMFTAVAKEAQRDREGTATPTPTGADNIDNNMETEDKADKKPRTASAPPAAREHNVGPLATQPPQTTPRDPTRDRSPRRTSRGTPAAATSGTIGGEQTEEPSGKGKGRQTPGPVVDINGQPSNARGGALVT